MNIGRKVYRIKSKSRFTISIATTLILFVFVANTAFGLNNASSMTKHEPTMIEIQTGDCLWDIAIEYGPSNADTREIVYEICSLNDITADTLRPGQTIYIPNYNQ